MGIVFRRYLALVILQVFQEIECVNITPPAEYRLYNDIFRDYNPLFRPRFNSAETVLVDVEFELNYIAGLEDVNEIMNSMGFVVAIWYDEFLIWNETDYENLEHLVINANRVWLPDIGIKNSATKFTDRTYREDFRVDILHDGRIAWKFGGKFATFCTLDMTYYPFDLQKCNIDIENWSYTSDAVDLRNLSNLIKLQEFSANGEWLLHHTSCALQTYGEDTHPGKLYPRIRFTVYLSRKFQYYIINIVLPALFVISISLMVFWLPPDSGEKVSLGVTVLLAFSVFQLVIMEHTPRTSDYTPMLTILVTIIMGEATFSVLTSILVLYYHHHGAESRPPKIIRFIAFKILAKLLFMNNQMPYKISSQDEPKEALARKTMTSSVDKPSMNGTVSRGTWEDTDETSSIGNRNLATSNNAERYLKDISMFINNYCENMNTKEMEQCITKEWKCVAKIIDRSFFCLSFTVTLIIIPVLLLNRDPSHEISDY